MEIESKIARWSLKIPLLVRTHFQNLQIKLDHFLFAMGLAFFQPPAEGFDEMADDQVFELGVGHVRDTIG